MIWRSDLDSRGFRIKASDKILIVIPAKAGTQLSSNAMLEIADRWVPAFAGMTSWGMGMTKTYD